MDQDCYILMKVFLKWFLQEGSFPFEEITEMVFNLVIRIDSEQFLSAEHYERIFENRSGFGNGYKPSQLATPVRMNYL